MWVKSKASELPRRRQQGLIGRSRRTLFFAEALNTVTLMHSVTLLGLDDFACQFSAGERRGEL